MTLAHVQNECPCWYCASVLTLAILTYFGSNEKSLLRALLLVISPSSPSISEHQSFLFSEYLCSTRDENPLVQISEQYYYKYYSHFGGTVSLE